MRSYRGALIALFFSIVIFAAVNFLAPGLGPDSLPATATNVLSSGVSGISAGNPTATPGIAATATDLPPTIQPAATVSFAALDKSTLREAVVTDSCVRKMNPLLAGYNQFDRDLTSLIYEGLLTTDQYGAPVPDLASAMPSVSQDGLTYVVPVRSDIKWHDGQPFSAEDVLFTIRLAQDSAFAGPQELQTFWQTVEIDLIDAQTIRFRLAQPLATFPDALRLGVLPKHVLEGVPARALDSLQFNLSPVGTGPYQFDALLGDGSRVSGVRLRYAATYAERPEGKDGFNLRQLIFDCVPSFADAIAAYQRGEVSTISQIPADNLPLIAALPLTPIPAYRPALGAVIYNWGRDSVAYFRDLRMRQALAHAVNRAGVVHQFLKGRALPADSPIIPRSWAYTPGVSCPTFDAANPDAAKQDLDRVQVKPPAPPTPDPNATPDPAAATPDPAAQSGGYNFTLLTTNDATMAAIAENIVASWRVLGLNVTLVVVDSATLKDRLMGGNFDAALVELNLEPGADPDPYSIWRQRPEDGGLNFGRLNERRLSELMESARRATTGADRVRLYQEFQRLFCERAAALLLYNPIYYYGVDARLSGVQLGFMSDYSDRFRTLQNWRFVESP